MALIKCPECGKEISNKAVKCPNCGYPLKVEQKKEKKEQKTLECPECHNIVDTHCKTCPYCGYTLKKKPQVIIDKIKNSWNDKKIRMAMIASIIIIVVIGGIVGYNCTHNEFTPYTKYIGKSYKKLSKDFKHLDMEDEEDSWAAYNEDENTKLFDIKGSMVYFYSKMDLYEYGTKENQIYRFEWDATKPSNKGRKKIIAKLIDVYGGYEKKKITDWTNSDYYKYGEKRTEYSWKNKGGLNIKLSVYDEDEDDKKIDEIYVQWTKVK